jgi:exodeoxyribonuclease VII large subunit
MAEFSEVELTVSEFVALFNQTLEYAYPSITITGELANFRVSKNRWVYFDLKDESSSVKFFGVVYQLPGPLEEGMMLKVRGQPKLHNLYGFSVNVLSMQPAGEGSIRKAQDLLRAKLQKEGLFDASRKRLLPYPPNRVGLITSRQSAAYADFVKVLQVRWGGVGVEVVDVQVQGEIAAEQIVGAVEQLNSLSLPPDVLILIRGGGSPEDLAAFSTEQVTRAVAASRIPTLVAIGHEIDVSLAELAADQRASTPSNAAELLVPDRKHAQRELAASLKQLGLAAEGRIRTGRAGLKQDRIILTQAAKHQIERADSGLNNKKQLLEVLNPSAVLKRGYAIVRQHGKTIRDAQQLGSGAIVETQLAKGNFTATVSDITPEKV